MCKCARTEQKKYKGSNKQRGCCSQSNWLGDMISLAQQETIFLVLLLASTSLKDVKILDKAGAQTMIYGCNIFLKSCFEYQSLLNKIVRFA